MKAFKPDSYSGTHFFGSFTLVHILVWMLPKMGINVELLLVAGIALVLGILWELVGDGVLGNRYGVKFFDKRGGDWGDIFMDAVGCLLGIMI